MKPVNKSIIVFYSIMVMLFWLFEFSGMIYTPDWRNSIPLWAILIIGVVSQIVAAVFVCIGVSAFLYGIFTVKAYWWKAFIPAYLIIISAAIYIFMPHSDGLAPFNMTYGNIRFWIEAIF